MVEIIQVPVKSVWHHLWLFAHICRIRFEAHIICFHLYNIQIGLPLAIIHPEIHFTLVDSVGKKLRAIDEMADELGIDNVSTYHGRAEEMIDLYPKNFKKSRLVFKFTISPL